MNRRTCARVGLLPLVGSQSIMIGMLDCPLSRSARFSACARAELSECRK